MKRIILVNVLLIAFMLTLNAGVNSVMQSYEIEVIEHGSSKVFNDTLDFKYHIMTSIEASIVGDDFAYVDVTLNKWVQDTVAGCIITTITVSVSKDAPYRELSVNLRYSYLFPNGYGSESSRWMINSPLTDVITFKTNKKINCFPNPTSGIVQVQGLPLNEQVNLSVYTISGRKVLEQLNSGETATLDLSCLKKGVYMISMDGDKNTTIKVSKE